MANPRIEELRKRLEKEPGSRLFAQLAEELRKDGELSEAIRVCREGLQRHPNYPSAHMTLGRALFDSGQLTGARLELEAVLRGAADNILASRLLGECLERLGDTQGALARFKSTLALVPGDRQVMAKIQALEVSSRSLKTPAEDIMAAASAAATLIMAAPVAPPAAPAQHAGGQPSGAPESSGADRAPAFAGGPADVYEPQPSSLAEVAEETFELEQPYEAAPTVVGLETGRASETERTMVDIDTGVRESEAPIPVAGADESFELERPHPSVATPTGPSQPPQAVAPATPQATLGEPADASFDFDAVPPEPAQAWHPPPPPAGLRPEFAEARREAPASGPAASEPEMSTVTLAELYFSQGVLEKAVEVYRQVLEREPGNERARTRLAEIEALDRQLREEEGRAAAEGTAALGPGAARRQAIERTIARLEALLASLKGS